uniref:Uncharacterized protein n=1 Tax=Tetranychus urticae TaxID=32264 RepID=T1KQ99_TETUR
MEDIVLFDYADDEKYMSLSHFIASEMSANISTPVRARGRASSSHRQFAAETLIRTIPPDSITKVFQGEVPVCLCSNHFSMITPTNVIIHRYHVNFDPIVESPKIRRYLIYSHREVFDNTYIYDGEADIKALREIAEPLNFQAVSPHNRQSVTINMQPTGKISWNHPEMVKKKDIPDHQDKVWPGILTAINEHDGGISCLYKIIRRTSALDILKRLKHNDKQFFNNARRELSGSIIMSHFNKKTYRIDDVIFDKNPVTYHFDKQVNNDIQPLLLVKPTEKQQRGGFKQDIILVPELCILTGITENMKNDMSFQRELDQHIRLDPVERLNIMKKSVDKIINNEQARVEMEQWNIALDPYPAEVNERVLPPEQIFLPDETRGIPGEQQSGSFDSLIRSEQLIKPVDLKYWVIVAPMHEKGTIEHAPKFLWLENDRTSTTIENFRKIPSMAKIVLIVVPNSNRKRYNAVKQYFCCEKPCLNQVLTSKDLNNDEIQFLIDLSLECPSKWAECTMFVGFSTCKDTDKRDQTVGAFVCSTNAKATSWFSQVSYHKTFEEMSSNFTANFKSGLEAWNRENNRFPKHIIIYHDVEKISALLDGYEDLTEAGIAFITVNKQLNARSDPNGPVKNPIAGTVIDSVVTRKERCNFYLISQSARFATVNPTMFHIIKDTTRWKPFHHQLLANKLCNLDYNLTDKISVPVPYHYAYKLAFLIGNYDTSIRSLIML